MARRVGISADSVHRTWKANDIKPHLVRTFKISTDPRFEEKFWDVIGLYLDPPERAFVLCCDEKSQWLARHPRFHLHFTPTGSSWMNLVERFFGTITDSYAEGEVTAEGYNSPFIGGLVGGSEGPITNS